jgi:SnoaL-like domain
MSAMPMTEVSQRRDATRENFGELLDENLARVFGERERDRDRRRAAIAELYAADAVLYEPHATATGYDAINEAVTTLLASLPAEFAFTATGPAVGHHGLARLRWSAGPANRPTLVTATDVAHIAQGRIQSLYVLLD